jgi:hypothetical protein
MVRFILSSVRYSCAAALVAALVGLALPACDQGAEGDRCNPDLIQSGGAVPQYNADECGSGLSCQIPPTCGNAYCCPSSPPYTDPNCACLANPAAGCACTYDGGIAAWLATQDAGEDSGAGEDSAVAATDSGNDSGEGTAIDSGSDAASSADAADSATPTKDATAE